MKLIKIIPLFVLLLIPLYTQSASVEVGSEGDAVVGQKFMVNFYLQTDNNRINTISGKIEYDPSKFKALSIDESDSVIGIWVDKPNLDIEGEIVWSGTIPGGFEGIIDPLNGLEDKGIIFSVTFMPLESDILQIKAIGETAYLHDGLGTEIDLESSVFNIWSYESQDNLDLFVEEGDLIPPEPFKINISRNPNIFNNNYFIAFKAKDSGSGIDHYEIKDGGEWIEIESPYLLPERFYRNTIYLKAIDRYGNARFATTSVDLGYPQNLPKRQIIYLIIIIIALLTPVITWRKLH